MIFFSKAKFQILSTYCPSPTKILPFLSFLPSFLGGISFEFLFDFWIFKISPELKLLQEFVISRLSCRSFLYPDCCVAYVKIYFLEIAHGPLWSMLLIQNESIGQKLKNIAIGNYHENWWLWCLYFLVKCLSNFHEVSALSVCTCIQVLLRLLSFMTQTCASQKM